MRRERLRARRRQLGYTQRGLAEKLGVGHSTVRDWELGKTRPLPGRCPPLARALEVSGEVLDEWLDEAEPPGEEPPFTAPDGHEVPEWLSHYASLEQAAGELWAWEPFVVPGLLQTEAYADAVERGGPDPATDDEVRRIVEVRRARQAVLDRRPHPLALSVVIDQTVLWRPVGDRRVMAGQLDHLAEIAGRPNVDLRVLPFEAREYSAGFGKLILLTARGAPRPSMRFVFDGTGADYSEKPHDVAPHTRIFRHLQKVALSSGDSVDLIRAVRGENHA